MGGGGVRRVLRKCIGLLGQKFVERKKREA